MKAVAAKSKPLARKIKLGLIGCGGRGPWLAELFKQHGGYELHAVADYFEQSAQQAGDRLGVDKTRRFSGLEGYKRLLQSGVEAVAVVNIPRFHAEHARAAIEAGCHVYAAKPVAIDVPRALTAQAAGKLATQKKLCYLVDYQMATDPVNIEVVRRVHEGGLGRLMHIESLGISPPWSEPRVNSREDRLRSGCWAVDDRAVGRRDHREQHPHHQRRALAGGPPPGQRQRPLPCVPAQSARRFPRGLPSDLRVRRRPAVDARRTVVEQSRGLGPGPEGLRRDGHRGRQLPRQVLLARRSQALRRTNIESLYDQGAIRNIGTFYDNVLQGRCDNPTVPPRLTTR